ncbi:MAG: hypothetical protein HY207_05825 [Nitrospirae bacterium]|nr:hypothetical protein [Nitrospirota bacterium]
MTIRTIPHLIGTGTFVAFCALSTLAPDASAQPLTPPAEGSENREATSAILVEVFLSPDHRNDLDAIKRELASASITRVRIQVFRLGHPPENLAIGKTVPAAAARIAIRLARQYNDGVKFLLSESRFFPDHIAIGTSAFDEASQIPVKPEDLDRLSDPNLTTAAFHELYRRLTVEDPRRPTYLR